MSRTTLYLFFDSELRTKGEPNWMGMLRLIRKEAKDRKEVGYAHKPYGVSYGPPSHNAGYIAFNVNFK